MKNMLNKIVHFIRRALFPLTLLSILFALPTHATLYEYYTEQGGTLPSIQERAKTAGAFGLYPYTGTAAQNNALERLLRGYQAQNEGPIGFGVASDYETTLAQSMTSNQTYLVVSSLLTRDGQTVSLANLNASRVYLTLEPGGSKEEFVMCTGVSTTLNRFDGCTRGLSGIGTSTASVAANMRSHIAGSKVTMSNVHYVYNEYVDRDTAQSIGGLKTFSTIPRIPTTTPTDPSEVVSFAMLASTSFAGTVNASTLVKGIVQLPTENEYSAGTVTGTTGALLVSTPAWNLAYSDHHFGNDLQYGQSLSYGDVVFVNSSTNKWNKALATDATVLNKIIAVAFDTTVTNTAGRVLYPGSVVYSGSGFTVGGPVYLSDTGVASVSPGTNRVSIGVALSTGAWIFNPDANFISSAVTSTANFIPVATASGTLQRGWIPFKFGGDCSDGALSAVNVTTTVNLGGAAVFIKNYSSITVTGTGTIAFSNPHANGTQIVFRSCGDVTLTSSNVNIDLRGIGAAGGAGNSAGAGAGGSNGTNWIAGLVGGGNGGAAAGAGDSGGGGAGGSSAASAGSAGTAGSGTGSGGAAGSTSYWNSESAPYILTYSRPGAGGGGGGSGNNNAITGGNGSRGGGGLTIEVGGALNFTGSINAAGTAGLACAGAAPYSGAGGGGGGGSVSIIYNTLTANSGTITVSGGNGGSCAAGSGGAGAAGFSKVSPNVAF